MKNFKMVLFSIMAMMFLLSGCGSAASVTDDEGSVSLTGLVLSVKTATVTAGESYILPSTGTAVYSDGSTKTVTVTWSTAVSTASAGEKVYVASYTEGDVTKTAIFTLTVNSATETGYKITIEDVTAAVDGSVEVTVNASGFSEKLAAVDIRLKIDTNYLQFTSGEFLTPWSGGLTIIKADSADSSIIMGASVAENSTVGNTLSGDTIKFKFKALKAGTTTVSISLADILDVSSVKLTGVDISDTATITIN